MRPSRIGNPHHQLPHESIDSRQPQVQFRIVGPEDRAALTEIFSDIGGAFFRPHALSPEYAWRIATYSGRNVYAILLDGGSPVAYGMLRGWDEGYSTPSVGIAVRIGARRKGYGRLMMAHLHSVARARGATQLRLRVHPENAGARRLYESIGYVYHGEDRGELVMVIDAEADTSPGMGQSAGEALTD